MRKTIALLLILILLLGAMPTLAVPPVDLNTLARYLPADAPVFVSLRTDDDFIQTLDTFITRINTAVPEGEDTIPSLPVLLDMAVGEMRPDATFADTIRPWLGDTAAFGFTSLDSLIDDSDSNNADNVVVAVSITDRELATSFLLGVIEENGGTFEQAEMDGYTLVSNPDADGALFILDDAILFTQTADVLDLDSAMADSLADNEIFTSRLALLPASDYNATVYISQSDLMEAVAASSPENAEAMGAFGDMFDSLGAQVWGFTILDGNSLVMDIAQEIADMTGLGFTMASTGPVDPTFARFIPANVLASIHGTDLNTSVTGGLDNLQAMLESQAAMLDEADMNAADIEAGIAQVEQGFTAVTGLDLRTEFLSWMTGDYALFASINPQLMGTISGSVAESPFELGFIVEVTDPAAAQTTVEGLSRSFTQLGALVGLDKESSNGATAEVVTEEIAGTEVTILNIVSPDVPFVIEILLAANDNVFAVGTRQAVTAALTGDGGLASNPAYMQAQAYVLPDTTSLGWLSVAALQPVIDLAGAFGSADDAATAQNIADLLTGGTLSSTIPADGITVSRAVLTFAE